jgi:hypothetical protein
MVYWILGRCWRTILGYYQLYKKNLETQIMATANKISELIVILKEKQAEYGDLDVVVEDDYMNYRISIRVDVDEEIIPVLVIG